MHQRRPNSSVIVATRNGSDSDNKSLEEKRAERRLAAKQRRDGGKKLKRVKRRTIKGNNLRWRKNPHLEIACFAFGLLALIGVTVFKLLKISLIGCLKMQVNT